MKTLAKTLALIALSIILVLIAHSFATAERGYNAIGGEALLLLLPALVYMFKSVAKQERENKQERYSIDSEKGC